MKNPLSTISNLAYVLAGVFAITENPPMAVFCILLGIASTGFHWSRSDAWHHLDIVAIYYLFFVGGGQLLLSTPGMAIGFVLASIAHWWFNFARTTGKSSYSTVIIICAAVLCFIGYGLENAFLDTLRMMGWFIGAGILKLIADSKGDEISTHYDKWHSLWHIATGVGIYILITC